MKGSIQIPNFKPVKPAKRPSLAVALAFSCAFALGSLGILSSPPAQAGEGGVGNGGVSVVCRNPQGRITSAEILDLFEGRNQFGRRYPAGPHSPDQLVELAQLKLVSNTAFLTQFRRALDTVRAGLVFLPRGIGLAPTNDAFPAITRKGCAFEQLANYKDDDGKIYVDQEIYRRLPKHDRAALLIHEAAYKMARDNRGETSSVRARKLTAQVLASNPDAGVIGALMAALAEKPMPPAPSPWEPAQLREGDYANDTSGFCGYRLYRNGDRVTLVGIDNPKNGLRCRSRDKGKTFAYQWAEVEHEGRAVKGYVKMCMDDPQQWCSLLEVINDRTFSSIQHSTHSSTSSSAIFFLWP